MRLRCRVEVSSGICAAVSQVAVLVGVKAVFRRRVTWKPSQVDSYRHVAGRRLSNTQCSKTTSH